MFKKSLLTLHVVGICIVGLHLISKYLFNIGFVQHVIFCIKIITVISGFVTAVLYWKFLFKKRYYFGIYPIGAILYLFGYFFRGFLGGLLMSVTMYPIVSDEVSFREEHITVYTKYTGFFSMCCTYGVFENVYGVFEKHYGEFRVNGQSDLKVVSMKNTSEAIKITFKDYQFNDKIDDYELENKTLTFRK